jgi:CRP-like cAMP-binding protein
MKTEAPSWREALKQCQVFSTLDDALLEQVASSLIEKRYEAGTVIFEEGDKATELLIVQEGKVALQMALPKSQTAVHRRITVDVVGKNDIVGWSALVEPNIYTLTAVCLQETRALSISGN